MIAAVLLREVPRSASFWMVPFGILALLFFGYTAALWTSSLVSNAPGTAEVNEKGISDHNRYHSLINREEIHHYAVATSGLQLHLHDREAFRGSRVVRFWDRISRAMGNADGGRSPAGEQPPSNTAAGYLASAETDCFPAPGLASAAGFSTA